MLPIKSTLSATMVAAALGITAGEPAAAQQSPRTMLILDGSGSMWGQIGGVPKIEIARGAVSDMLDDWPDGREIGLTVYGHREKGDCGDIETALPPAPLDRAAFDAVLADVTPRGKTPLTAATEGAARALSHADTPATVILVTDGRETCAADPCAAARTLERTGTDFTAHVIGFDVGDAASADLSCLAEATGGRYLAANDADALAGALQTAAAPEPAPAIRDSFDRPELGPDWEVLNPDPNAYILDEGALVSLTSNDSSIGDADQTNVFRWTGGALPDGDWTMEVDFSSEFSTRRSVVELALYEGPENFVAAELVGDGSSNDRIELRLKTVVDGEVTRARALLADDACCPRDYDTDAVMTQLKEQGGTLLLHKRGREFTAAFETPDWTPRDGQPDPLVTDPLTVLRASGDPVLFSGTWGRDSSELVQTVTEFDAFRVMPR